jgi:sugar/nucleoside kinase (ribokinase family)
MGKILAVGNGVADIIVRCMNELDFKQDLHLLDELRVSNGGDTMNTSIGLARLGMDVSIVCLLSDDIFSDFLWNKLQQEGIDTRFVKRIKGQRCSTSLVIINDSGDRTFYSKRGVNSNLTVEDVPLDHLGEFQIVHASNYFVFPQFVGEGAAKMFAEAKLQGCTTTLDVTWDVSGRWLQTLSASLKNMDYFLPSEVEAAAITGQNDPDKMAEVLLNEGAKNVVIKLGKNGCYFKNATQSFLMPAYDVQTVDTTGAGDAFVAGFQTGLVKNWNMIDTCRLAVAMGGYCVRYVGTTTEAPNMIEILKFMEETPQRKFVL